MRLPIPKSPEIPQLKWLVKGIRQCDKLLTLVAVPFGVRVRSTPVRWMLFVLVHGAIYWLASGREVFGYGVGHEGAIGLLVFAWVGLFAIARAWVGNEKDRSNIVHKLVEDALPDRLPDLRVMAAVSGLQTFVIFPMLFWRLSLGEENQLFSAAPEGQAWDWCLFTLAQLFSAVPFVGTSEGFMSSFENGITGVMGNSRELIPSVVVSFEDMVDSLHSTVSVVLFNGTVRAFKIRRTFQLVLTDEALRNGHERAARMGCRAVNPLRRQLKNTDEVVQIQAARALGEIGDARAVVDLIEVLQSDSKWPVREAAASALGQIGDIRAVPGLTECLLDHGGNDAACLRNSVARSLGQLGDCSAVLPLLDGLNRYREDLSCRLEEAKTVLFDSGANSPQFEIEYESDLTDPSGDRVYGPDGVPATCRTTLSGRVVNSGTDVDEESQWPYIEIQTDDRRCECVFLRIDDLQPLDSVIGPQAGQRVQAAYEFVRNGINSFYSDDQIVSALGRIRDPQASPRLVELIREADSLPGMKWLGEEQVESFREHIVLSLGQIGDPTSAEGLLSVLDGEFSESLKQRAAVVLGQLGAPDNVPDPESWTEGRLKDVTSRYEEWVNGKPGSVGKSIREKVSNLRFRLDRGVDEMDNHLRIVSTSLRGPKPPFSIRVGHERMSVDEVIQGHTLRVQRGVSGLPRAHPVGGDVFVVTSDKWSSTTGRSNPKPTGLLRMVAGMLLVGVLGILGTHQVLSGNESVYAGSDFANKVAEVISGVHQAVGAVLPVGTSIDSTLFQSVLFGVPAVLLLPLIIGWGRRKNRSPQRPESVVTSPREEPVAESGSKVLEQPAIALVDNEVLEVADDAMVEMAEEPVLVVADAPVIEMAEQPVLEESQVPLRNHASELDDPLLEGVVHEETAEPVEDVDPLAGGDDSEDLDAFLDIIGEDV